MGDARIGDMTAAEAARALADLPAYEEGITGRAFAITMMAYGIASAAIGLTYHASEPWILERGVEWVFSFLWVPWILAATLLTITVWHTQAITFDPDGEHRHGGSAWFAVILSAVYMGLMAGVYLLFEGLGWQVADPIQNLYVLGLFTAVLGAVFRRKHGRSRLVVPVFGAAAFAFGLGLLGQLLVLQGVPALWWGTGGVLVSYMGAGLVIAGRA